MRDELEARLEVRSGVKAERILTAGGADATTGGSVTADGRTSGDASGTPQAGDGRRVTGVLLDDGSEVGADAVIVAPGREGARWLVEECRRLGICSSAPTPWISACASRCPAASWSRSPASSTRSKLVYFSPSFEDQVRTFCMNPYGEVSHRELRRRRHRERSQLRRPRPTAPTSPCWCRPTSPSRSTSPSPTARSIARLANLLGEDIIVQRLGDLQQGHRSTAGAHRRRGTVEPTLERRHARRPRLRAAVPPPARHPRDARGDGRTGAGRRRPRYAAIRCRGQVLLVAPGADRALETPIRACSPSATAPASPAGLVQASAAGISPLVRARGGDRGRAIGERRRRDAASEGGAVPATIVIGAQWGDEGKGKITDLLAEKADVVVRYPGRQQRRPHRSCATARSSSSTSSPPASCTPARPASSATASSSTRSILFGEIDGPALARHPRRQPAQSRATPT